MNTAIVYPSTMLSPIQYELPQVLEKGHVLSVKESNRLARLRFMYDERVKSVDHIVEDNGYKLIRHTRSRKVTLWEY